MPSQNQSDPNQVIPQDIGTSVDQPPANNSPVQEPVTPMSFSQQSDLPPLPPDFQNIPQESGNTTPPVESTGSAAPSNTDISSVPSKPKKKFGGGKIIATILGLFILVGGLGTGVFLTQQQQDIRSKAGFSCSDSSECGSGMTCSGGSCKSVGGTSGSGDTNVGGSNGTTTTVGNNTTTNSGGNGTTTINTQTDSNNCGSLGTVCGTGKECSSGKCVSASGGGNGTITSTCTNQDPTTGQCYSYTSVSDNGTTTINTQTDSNNCGSLGTVCGTGKECIGGKCVSASGGGTCASYDTITKDGVTYNNNDCAVKSRNVAGYAIDCSPGYYSCTIDPDLKYEPFCCKVGANTPPPAPTAPPTNAPQCLYIKVYDVNWTEISASDLSKLKTGDKLRFTVTGSPAASFDKAKFTITAGGNVTDSGEITQKKPSSDEYYYEYTITSGTTSISISAQIHSTTIGWF